MKINLDMPEKQILKGDKSHGICLANVTLMCDNVYKRLTKGEKMEIYKNVKIKTIIRNGQEWLKVQGHGMLFASMISAKLFIDNKCKKY